MKIFAETINRIYERKTSNREKRYQDFRDMLVDLVTHIDPNVVEGVRVSPDKVLVSVGKNVGQFKIDVEEIAWCDEMNRTSSDFHFKDIETVRAVFATSIIEHISKTQKPLSKEDNRSLIELMDKIKDKDTALLGSE